MHCYQRLLSLLFLFYVTYWANNPACWNSESLLGEGGRSSHCSICFLLCYIPILMLAFHCLQNCLSLSLYPEWVTLCRRETSYYPWKKRARGFLGPNALQKILITTPVFTHLPLPFPFAAILKDLWELAVFLMASPLIGLGFSFPVYHVFIHFPDSSIVLTTHVGCSLFSWPFCTCKFVPFYFVWFKYTFCKRGGKHMLILHVSCEVSFITFF